MTPFCRAVVDLIKAAPNHSLSAYELRVAVMEKGFGKHPAAVAMNLTKLAFKGEYVTCFVRNNNQRYFLLTSEGLSS